MKHQCLCCDKEYDCKLESCPLPEVSGCKDCTIYALDYMRAPKDCYLPEKYPHLASEDNESI